MGSKLLSQTRTQLFNLKCFKNVILEHLLSSTTYSEIPIAFQVVLSTAWLILMPPKTGAWEGAFRCAPPTTFEEGLVVSLVYVMLLLAITALFAMLTWQCQDNNKESRWILACTLTVGMVWLAWTVLSTQLPVRYRDAAICVANLANATIIMVCLYLRKVRFISFIHGWEL